MITKYYEKIRGSWEANAACFVNTGWRTTVECKSRASNKEKKLEVLTQCPVKGDNLLPGR